MPKLLSIGADPEYLLLNPDGEIVPSCGLIGGSKGDPIDLGNGRGIQEDNVTVEVNIAPIKSVNHHIDRNALCNEISTTIELAEEALPPGYSLYKGGAIHYFNPAVLRKAGWQAMTFGCSPTINAYTGYHNPSPKPPPNGLRTCSGDIHIAYENPNPWTNEFIAVALDCYMRPSTRAYWRLPFNDPPERRALYGLPGSYRNKPYGLEYKVLSNAWTLSRDAVHYVADAIAGACVTADNPYAVWNELKKAGGQEALTKEYMGEAV